MEQKHSRPATVIRRSQLDELLYSEEQKAPQAPRQRSDFRKEKTSLPSFPLFVPLFVPARQVEHVPSERRSGTSLKAGLARHDARHRSDTGVNPVTVTPTASRC